DEAVAPAKLDREPAEEAQHLGRRLRGEARKPDDPHVELADPGLEAPGEVLAREDPVQIHRNLRDADRMPEPCHTRMEVREEGGGVEPTEGKPRRERVLHVGDRLSEDLEDVPPPPADLAIAFEEEGRETGLDGIRPPV